jgi:tRNA (cmo5U34)-methyltransferase
VRAVTQFHFTPESYLREIRDELPAYDDVQAEVADAAAGVEAARILDLGAGTGETAAGVLARQPSATVVLLDESAGMLDLATARLPAERVERAVVGDLLDALPTGRFDLVVSALAVHHLAADRKRSLFEAIRSLLPRGGRFVLADVVIPLDPADAVTPLSPGYDRPDRLDDQVAWLTALGFDVTVRWRHRDLAILTADRVG